MLPVARQAHTLCWRADRYSKWRLPVSTPPTTFDEEGDDGAKERCETLNLLKHARASRLSFVRELPWNTKLLRLLPPTIASPIDPEKVAAAAAAKAAGKSFKEFDPRATAKRAREPQSLEIREGDRNGVIYLYPCAWGDLDGDGVEELVLSVMNADAHGPMSSVTLLVLSRASAKEQLRVVRSF